jgi:hypothetical protein
MAVTVGAGCGGRLTDSGNSVALGRLAVAELVEVNLALGMVL